MPRSERTFPDDSAAYPAYPSSGWCGGSLRISEKWIQTMNPIPVQFTIAPRNFKLHFYALSLLMFALLF